MSVENIKQRPFQGCSLGISMSDLKAKFLTIERPLLPRPPASAVRPYWCLSNTLIFYDKNGQKVWEKKIPEALPLWMPILQYDDENNYPHWHDEFKNYFQCEVINDPHFGWQLRMTISHKYADFWHEKMMRYIKRYHKNHFKKG